MFNNDKDALLFAYLYQYDQTFKSGSYSQITRRINLVHLCILFCISVKDLVLFLLHSEKFEVAIFASNRVKNGVCEHSNFVSRSYEDRTIFYIGRHFDERIKDNEAVNLLSLKIASGVICYIIEPFYYFYYKSHKNKNSFPRNRYFMRREIIFYLESWFFQFLLKRRVTKKLFLVGGGYMSAFIYSARTLGLKSIEIQHGVINKQHPSYNWGDMPQNYNPMADEILLLGDIWKKRAEYHELVKIFVVDEGAETVELEHQTNYDIGLDNFNLLICDDVYFIEFILTEKTNLQRMAQPLVVKLHPKYYHIPDNEILKLLEIENAIFVRKEVDNKFLIENAQYVVAINSTLIFNAIDWGRRPSVTSKFAELFSEELNSGKILLYPVLDDVIEITCSEKYFVTNPRLPSRFLSEN